MGDILKLYVFCQVSVLLCIGVQARPSKDSNLLKSLSTHELSELNANDEGKAFQEWVTKENNRNNKDSDHVLDDGTASLSDDPPENIIFTNNDKNDDDDQGEDDGDYKEDDQVEDNGDYEEYDQSEDDGDYEDDQGEDDGDYGEDDQGEDDGDYEEDDQGEDDGDYGEDDQGEMNDGDYEDDHVGEDGEENDEYDDDNDLKDDLPENEIVNKNDEVNENSQHAKKKASKGVDPFNFEDDPALSASDAIYRINSHTGSISTTYEEDIVIDPSRVQKVAEWGAKNGITKRMAVSVRSREYRWPGGVVVYRIDRNSRDRFIYDRTSLDTAIAEYASKTCIKFQEVQDTSRYHIRLMSGSGCYSYVGRLFGISGFSQSQDVSIGRGCNYRPIIVHEFLHALGFWHEQSRPDRDSYVRILWENIQGGRENNNFQKHTAERTTNLGVEYDYESVMHYGETAFAINRGQLTIQRLRGTGSLGQPINGGLSAKDAEELNRFYGCNTPGTTAPPPTTPSTTPPTTPSTTPPTTPSTRPPPTARPDSGVRVFIKSVGCNDPGVIDCGASESEIRVNDVAIPCPNRRGACVAILDGVTGRIEGRANEMSTNLASYLRSLKPKKLILGTVKGTWWSRYRRYLRRRLYRIGVSGRRVYYRNAPFAFIGWSGPGKISVTKGIYARRRGGPVVISQKIDFPLA